MNVRQVAEYLQLNEKKVYTLLSEGKLPATKITGKWLFPRHLVDHWLIESAHGGVFTDRLILSGSDDPLLHRLIAQMANDLQHKALIVYTPTGTQLGLSLLANHRTNVCALHWGPYEESHHRHPALIARHPQHHDWVLIRIFKREQGLMVSPRFNAKPDELGALLHHDLRWVFRQEGAGSQRYLQESLALHHLNLSQLQVCRHAFSEREAASLIAMHEADIGPGIRSSAAEFGLDFFGTGWEAFDFALYRDIYFRRLFQDFVKRIKSDYAKKLANTLGGYDLSELGELVWSE